MKNLIKGLKIVVAFLVLLIIAVVLLFGHRDIPFDQLKAKYANTASSFIAVNGMVFIIRTRGTRPTLYPSYSSTAQHPAYIHLMHGPIV